MRLFQIKIPVVLPLATYRRKEKLDKHTHHASIHDSSMDFIHKLVSNPITRGRPPTYT